MSVFYNKTITVFNYTPSDDLIDDELWMPTVLHNVRLLESNGVTTTTNNTKESDNVRLHIDLRDTDKPYMTPKEWAKLDISEKSQYFTLCQDKDFFIVGDYQDKSETVEGEGLFNRLKESMDGVYQITSVGKFDLIPHLEVGGK